MKGENDIYGESTLNSISSADKFNKWMYDQMKPYMKGRILEIGSGIGNISKILVNDQKDVVLSDYSSNYIDLLKEKFENTIVLQIDLVDPNFETKHKNLFGDFDFIFALNVVEHIEDHELALKNIYKLLKNHGVVFILVPAYQGLFNKFDIALQHHRRYTRKTLQNLFTRFKLINSYYFNFIGIFGWFIVGKVLGKKIIPESNMKIYNTLVPIFKIVDKIIFNKVGLSVIQIAKK